MPSIFLFYSWFLYLFVGYGEKPRSASHINPFDPLFIKHAAKVRSKIIWWNNE